MSARPPKRPRTRSVARRERKEGPALASVLLPIVQQGFLRHQELGRLGQTSRQLNKQCKEELWKTLCFYRWPITADFTEDWIVSLGGYSGWYCRMNSPIREQPSEPPPLDPPSLRPDDVEILVTISRRGEPLLSEALDGPEVRRILAEGCVRFGLPNPVPLGQAGCFLEHTCSCDARCRFNLIGDFDITMQLFRGDATSCRIYQSMKRNPEYCDTREGNHWGMNLGPGVPNEKLGLSLGWSPMAGCIHHRIRAAVAFDVFPIVGITEQQGEEVAAVTSIQIAFMKLGIGDDNWTPFEPKEEAEKHGVTILHILQELQSAEL